MASWWDTLEDNVTYVYVVAGVVLFCDIIGIVAIVRFFLAADAKFKLMRATIRRMRARASLIEKEALAQQGAGGSDTSSPPPPSSPRLKQQRASYKPIMGELQSARSRKKPYKRDHATARDLDEEEPDDTLKASYASAISKYSTSSKSTAGSTSDFRPRDTASGVDFVSGEAPSKLTLYNLDTGDTGSEGTSRGR